LKKKRKKKKMPARPLRPGLLAMQTLFIFLLLSHVWEDVVSRSKSRMYLRVLDVMRNAERRREKEKKKGEKREKNQPHKNTRPREIKREIKQPPPPIKNQFEDDDERD